MYSRERKCGDTVISKALFNVGDKIRIVGYQDNIDSMERLVGRIAHINFVEHSAKEDELSWYYLREVSWNWREDWLELAEPKTEREDIEELL